MSNRLIVVLIFTAIFLKELFFILPKKQWITPFPFYPEMEITKQSYFYMACSYAGMMIIAFIFSKKLGSFWIVGHAWFILQAVEFADFFFTYNTHWFSVFGIGIGITLLKFCILFLIITYKLIKQWRTL